MHRRQFLTHTAALPALSLPALSMFTGTAFADTPAGEDEDLPLSFLDELRDSATDRSQIKKVGAGQLDFSRVPGVKNQETYNGLLKLAQTEGKAAYDDIKKAGQGPRAAKKAEATDYWHLSVYGLKDSDRTFELTGETLKSLFDRNSFPLEKKTGKDVEPLVIFGLRGCSFAERPDDLRRDWSASHTLRAGDITHDRLGCLIGVWRLSDNAIVLYKGSTVPCGVEMFMAMKYTSALGTSLLPTGRYVQKVGTLHEDRADHRQPGSLKIADTYWVLRCPTELEYNPRRQLNYWTYGGGHDVHASGSTYASLTTFDSAGCQVIPGWVTKDSKPLGPPSQWLTFQKDAGLAEADGTPLANYARTYRYVVLTGDEAALTAHRDAYPLFDKTYYRLRHGSKGQKVADLLARMGKPSRGADSYFDASVTEALLLTYKSMHGDHISHVYDITAGLELKGYKL